MTNKFLKLAGPIAGLFALAATASAEFKLNENITTDGFVVGSYQFNNPVINGSPEGTGAQDHLDVDAAKLGFALDYKPITGVMSFYYQPNTSVHLRDAYVAYNFANGFSVSGGKFQSWLGFEAFDAVNRHQISRANDDFLRAIPGYHSGVRLEYAAQDYSTGVAVVDSIYEYSYLKGDGELRYNRGVEGYFKYKGIKDLTLFAGLAFESRVTGNRDTYYSSYGYFNYSRPSILTLDLWASYQLDPDTLVAAEFVYKDRDGTGDQGYNWLFLTDRKITEKLSTAFRVSGEHIDSNSSYYPGESFTKFTLAPSYKVTANLTIRGEVSYYNYANNTYAPYTETTYYNNSSSSTRTYGPIKALDHSTFVGIQALFQF